MEHAQVRVNGTLVDDYNIDSKYEICVRKNIDYGFSRGVFSPFHYVLPVTLLQVSLFLIASRLIFFILRPIRTPKFVCSFLAGILLGPSVLGHNKKFQKILFPPIQAEILMFVSPLFIMYSVFIVTMKMEAIANLKNTRRTWKFGTIPSLSCFVVMVVLFFLLFPTVSPESDTMPPLRILLSTILSLNNYPVISENLLELNLITSELGQIASSATFLNEVVHWILLTMTAVVENKGAKHTVLFLCSFTAYICSCIFVAKAATLMIVRATPPGKRVRQGYVVLIQMGVLAVGIVGDILGLTYIQGPLLMGLVMPNGPPLATALMEKTEGIILHFLMPLYFCYIGGIVDVFAIQNWSRVMKVQFVIIAGSVAKIAACMLLSLTYKIRLKHGLVLGLMLNFKGIIDLIIFTRFRGSKVVDDQIFSHLVFAVIGYTLISFPLVQILYKPHTRLETFMGLQGKKTIKRTIQNTPRNSELCIVSCVHKEGEVRSIIALLEAINPTPANPICVYVIHLVELSAQSTPLFRPINIKKRKSLNYPSASNIIGAFDNYARNSDDDSVTVVPFINVAPYKSMHESVCHFAQDNSIPLIIIPFHQNDRTPDGGVAATATATRDLNTNFQAYAASTVGILVDRHSRLGVSNTPFFSFHVAIFFMGGPDDREALALGMRMAECRSTSMVVFRFVLQNHEIEETEEEYEQRRIDEVLIDEFIAMKFGKEQLEYYEINVEGSEQVYETIRSLQRNYDLVMVGRKHRIEFEGFNDEEEVSNLLENADVLGLFGDMLASSEFCNGMVPVLVTHSVENKVKTLGRKHSLAESHASVGSRFW